ncbi:DUF6777 domain-containing protein [Streptomyces sp. NRRL B-24085]|uniref:DUF6777 domain-containing protein n=1 Tax=Streptomyces sp. NRRL B-24085 TaxID=1709476 RepID=UPI00211B2FCD|nr:DUF6777 domain-containing protein [Streptomyces sp. NRRL B-24085]
MRRPTRTLATAGVLAAALLVAGCGREESTGEPTGMLLLQPAAARGPNPFTPSAATAPPPLTRTPHRDATAPRTVSGGTPGLYGGTERVGSCDVKRQIRDLTADLPRTSAFAPAAGVRPAGVPAFLRALAPVVLRADTRVTNHGYRDGAATSYQAVLQAGTAVLVDDRGVPRTRCACGNPLTPPVAQQTTPKRTGDSWPSYDPSNVVVVAPSTTVIDVFVLYDPDHHDWVARQRGDTGGKDHKTHPPAKPSPPVSVSPPTTPSTPSSPNSPEPCVSTSSGAPSGSSSPCAPALIAPSSPPSSPPSPPPPPSSDSPGESSAPDSSSPQPPLVSDTTASTTQSAPLSGAALSWTV